MTQKPLIRRPYPWVAAASILLAGTPTVIQAKDTPPGIPASITTPAGWNAQRSGSDLVMTPGDLPAGKTFTLTIQPEMPLGANSLEDWFTGRMQTDAPKVGAQVQNSAITPQANGTILTSVRGGRTENGVVQIIAYMAFHRPGGRGEIARIVSTPDKSFFGQYMREAMNVVVPLVRGANTSSSSPTTTTSSDERRPAPKSTPFVPRDVLLRAQYTVKPGNGLKASQIFGVYTRMRMQFGVGGYAYPVYEPFLVLKDGTLYDDFDVPPGEFDAAAARRLRPKEWEKWRREGGKFQTLSSKGVWEDEKWIGPYKPVPAGEKLTGTYSHIGGGGNTAFGGTTVIAAVNEFTFLPDGHFKGGSNASASTDGPGASVVATSSHNYDGTYQIDGYGITFRYSDGRTDRRTFMFMDLDNNKDALYLNGTSYLKEKEDHKK